MTKHYQFGVCLAVAATVAGCTLSSGSKGGPSRRQWELRGTRENVAVFVTNQTFKQDPAHVMVSLDGKPVIDGQFEYGDAHRWHEFFFRVKPGKHHLFAHSGDGSVRIQEEFTVDHKKFLLVAYWGDKLTIFQSDDPLYAE